jgi:hypothetical protein
MRTDRSLGISYGMDWEIKGPKQGGSAYPYSDPGYYGSVSSIDIERRYGTVVCLQEYTGAADGGVLGQAGWLLLRHFMG